MTKVVTSRTFRSGDSEAVALPEEVAFGEGVEVEIVKHGNSLTIRPKAQYSGRDLVEALAKLPKPKNPPKREPIEFPKRRGL